jgi:aspartyl-tRNA(Asn)/glutamyl-tRNA(Gln) amidotransferase subunit B
MVDLMSVLNSKNISIKEFTVQPEYLSKLINLISDNVISNKIAKEVFQIMLGNNQDPEVIVKEKNLIQISDEKAIIEIVNKVIDSNPDQLNEYLSGKDKVVGFFVGQIMKLTKGKANPQLVNKILIEQLNNKKSNL